MRKAIVFILAIVAVITLSIPGSAEPSGTLDITLEPTQAASEQEPESAQQDTLVLPRKQAVEKPKQTASKEIPIGRVGVISAPKAAIRRTASNKSHSLYTCPKDTCLAITNEKGSWYGILMSDMSTGWIEKKHVQLLNYQLVTQAGQENNPGSQIINTALRYLGIRYQWGGYSGSGLDCSGFVKAVFAGHGINLPRVSRDQVRVGAPVGWSQLQPGDRLYFACKGGDIDHTGIYMGNGLFIHSSVSRGGVAVDNILKPFYANTLVAARR